MLFLSCKAMAPLTLLVGGEQRDGTAALFCCVFGFYTTSTLMAFHLDAFFILGWTEPLKIAVDESKTKKCTGLCDWQPAWLNIWRLSARWSWPHSNHPGLKDNVKSFTNPEYIGCLFSVSENFQIPICATTNSNTINLDLKGIKIGGKKLKKTAVPAFVHLEQMIFHDLPCCNLRSRCSCQRAYPGLPAKCLNPLACMIFWLFCLQSIRFTQDEKLLLQRSAENEPLTHILSAHSCLCLFRYNMSSDHTGAVMNWLFVYCVWAF